MCAGAFLSTTPNDTLPKATSDVSMHTDSAALTRLLIDVARHDRRAFEKLYRASSARLFGICMRLLRDRTEAEDVLQEVYVLVWERAAQFDSSRANGLTWLCTVARNRCIDRLRSVARPDRSVPLETDVLEPGAGPLHAAGDAEQRDRLFHCLSQLEPRRQNLIRVAFMDGATYQELSQRDGSPLGTVKSWIRRGLAQLRTCLEQH